MLIDVAKSQVITQLLGNIVIGLSKLSSQDMALWQKINEMKGFLSQPQVDSNVLLNTFYHAREISASYNVKDHRKDPYVINLPKMFSHLITETEHQAKMKELAQPNEVARLALEVKRFCKLARIL